MENENLWDGYWYHIQNGILIDLCPSDGKTFRCHTPKIECYFETLREAVFYLRDKRRMRSIRRYQKKTQKEIF